MYHVNHFIKSNYHTKQSNKTHTNQQTYSYKARKIYKNYHDMTKSYKKIQFTPSTMFTQEKLQISKKNSKIHENLHVTYIIFRKFNYIQLKDHSFQEIFTEKPLST